MATENNSRKKSSRPDISTFAGLALALGGIVGGLVLEGGRVTDVAQITALMIVLGGTVGAVMVTTPLSVLLRAARNLGKVFFEQSHEAADVIEELIGYASKARKSSIVSLEADLERMGDPFLKKAISLAVDGTDLQEIRKMMEIDMMLEERSSEACAKVYECAGGYSPTIGIIGAVLGLIQVMKHLENIDEVGRGIAVAFVATVYGVAMANLFFLPVASKIKTRAQQGLEVKELILEGVCSIVEGLNPKLIRLKLEGFALQDASKVSPERANLKQSAQTVAARS